MFIAIVDDDEACLDMISDLLSSASKNAPEEWSFAADKGWQIDTFKNAKDLMSGVRKRTYNLVILDWMLPDNNGIDIIRWMDEYLQSAPPVIMVTNRDAEQDVVDALSAGAEDFVTKPFRSQELVARVLSTLRRHHVDTQAAASNAPLNYGSISVIPGEETVQVNGKSVKLTAQEYRLTLLFLNNLNRPLSRSYLYERVWGKEENPFTRTLDVHVYRLRKKLELNVENGWKLSSLYRYGYRLHRIDVNNGEVTEEGA